MISYILHVLQSRLAKFFAALQPIGDHIRDRGVRDNLHGETVQLDLGELLVPPLLCVCQVPEGFAETAGLPVYRASDLDPICNTAAISMNASDIQFFEVVSFL